MSDYRMKMPRLGESITEATITRWLKEVGDLVDIEEPILEIATDKVDTEIPSPVTGILKEQRFQEGDTITVDSIIAIIETDSDDTGASEPIDTTSKETSKEASSEPKATASKEASQNDTELQQIPFAAAIGKASRGTVETTVSARFYSPLVRSIAKEEGLSISDLDSIKGSGKRGRLTKQDIIDYVKSNHRRPVADTSTTTFASQTIKGTPIQISEGDEVIIMDRIRKLTAQNMVKSEATSVHISLFAEADMTNLVNWRNQQKVLLKKRENEKLTFTPLFIEAIAKALRDHPMVNICCVDEEKIIKRKNINIGMAASLPNGNLIVPVIKHADHKSLIELAREVNDLANRARNYQLKPDEIQNGTFTLTNFGSFGTLSGTPIINQPQVAILGVGMIEKKPSVAETPQGDTIVIRHKMILSLACDHRVVDGALGSQFLKSIKDYLENFDTNQNI